MIFLAAMLWPRPRHPRVGRVLGCEDFEEDVDEDFDKDVDEDIDEDEDVIENVDEGAISREYILGDGWADAAAKRCAKSHAIPTGCTNRLFDDLASDVGWIR